MGISEWFLSKGMVGAISKDMVRKYIIVQKGNPEAPTEDIAAGVWDFWLELNEEAIREEDGLEKVIRLDYMMDRNKEREPKRLLGVFADVLYIETEILKTDSATRRMYENAVKIFVKEAEKNGIDLTREYENERRLMERLNL